MSTRKVSTFNTLREDNRGPFFDVVEKGRYLIIETQCLRSLTSVLFEKFSQFRKLDVEVPCL
jgi:hypothetical protein